MIETLGTWWMWSGFAALVAALIAIDMRVLRARGAHKVPAREALLWSLGWVALALLFATGLWGYLAATAGREPATETALAFLTGYLIEKSLSVDNLFVFLTLFGYFAVPPEYQRRVLLYGVLGAIVMRAVMILLGAVLLARFHWILYLFGAFLVITGIRMLVLAEHTPDVAQNPLLRWMRGHLRITDGYHGDRFVLRHHGLWYVTPLFLVVVLIELTDLVFAVDSIPAVYAVTDDPFIVFTSNIFAILGLRAMYFLLADVAGRFHLLRYGLALVLVLVGAKTLAADLYPIPTALALAVVALVISASVAASLLAPPREAPAARSDIPQATRRSA